MAFAPNTGPKNSRQRDEHPRVVEARVDGEDRTTTKVLLDDPI